MPLYATLFHVSDQINSKQTYDTHTILMTIFQLKLGWPVAP